MGDGREGGAKRIRNFLMSLANILQLYVLDLVLLAAAMLLFALTRSFASWITQEAMLRYFIIQAGCNIVAGLMFRTDRSLWRYADSGDYLRLVIAYGVGFIAAFCITRMLFQFPVPGMFMLSSVSFALVMSLAARALFRTMMRRQEAHSAKEKTNTLHTVIVLGAGMAGIALVSELQQNPNSRYHVVALLDDDPIKNGKSIRGVIVKGQISRLPELLKFYKNAEVILAIPSLPLARRREIIEMCVELKCRFRLMPETLVMMQRGGFAASVRSVQVEDLLSREAIKFSRAEMERFIGHKTVLITGGGGSIGSELCRQVAGAGVGRLVIFDVCENESYLLFRELKESFGSALDVAVEIGSVTDERRLHAVFAKYRPDVVFHAAAHKHVPLMEISPYEAVQNNIFGTWRLLQTVEKYQVKKFVLISTDKAVNPTNVMGATKRYCEIMCRAMACKAQLQTDYVAVRFGNVLGSSGSVLPLFRRQLDKGGPITVTDKKVTRFFMTIPEAAGLVIKAASMASRSETYILDMGKPVHILELAENFIRLSGYKPYQDIAIVETGLRPGEKLYEELLLDDEKHKSTSVSRIFVEKDSEIVSVERVENELRELQSVMDGGSEELVLNTLHRLVPTFKTPEEVNGKFRKEEDSTDLLQKAQAVSAS